MNEIKVSIIMPVYNVEKYLDRAIQSAINQTYKNIEIIIVNDGSTDNSEQIISDYTEKDKRIIYIKQKNTGLSEARNSALKIATGEYVFFFDSDDFIEEDAIEKMISVVKKYNKADMVICNYKVIYEYKKNDIKYCSHLKEPNENIFVKDVDFMKDLYLNFKYENHVWDKLYKLSIINENNLCFKSRMIEDVLFNIQIYPYLNNIAFSNEYLYNYCIRENSITGKYCNNLYEQYMELFNLLEKDYEKNKKTIKLDEFLGYNIYNLLALCSKNSFEYRHYKQFYMEIKEMTENEKLIYYNEKMPKIIENKIKQKSKKVFLSIQTKMFRKKLNLGLWLLFFIKYKLNL